MARNPWQICAAFGSHENALLCAPCRLKLIATITDPEVVRKLLTSLGLPVRGPPVVPARDREQREFDFEA